MATNVGSVGTGLLALLLAALAGGCGAGADEDEAEAPLARPQGVDSGIFRRVVIARAYQGGVSTLPDVGPHPDGPSDIVRDAGYVCAVLAAFEPTYVSGLIRLGGKFTNDKGETMPRDDVTEEQIVFFDGVRDCMKNEHGLSKVRFDVVLNATLYETAVEVVNHVKQVRDKLHPDAIYFDFFQNGYFDHPKAIGAAIQWIQDHDMFVGGTIWGHRVPPKADYVALDDFDDVDPKGGTHVGWDRMTSEAKRIHEDHEHLPVLFHIENNPTGKENNHGEQWIRWQPGQRINLLDKHASHQASVGYEYMYPVFFPLSRKREGALAPFSYIGGDRVLAYDLFLDPDVFDETKHLMDKFDKLGGGK
jgi:hypothetical protein